MPLHLLPVFDISIVAGKQFHLGVLKKGATKGLCVSAEIPEGCLSVEMVARRHFSRKVPLENELRLCP